MVDAVVLYTASYEMRGMETYVLDLAQGLARRGVDVASICDDRSEIAPLRQGLAEVGPVHAIPERRSVGSAARIRALSAALRRYRSRLLHVHHASFTGGDLVVAAARRAGYRTVVRTEHNPPSAHIGLHDRLRVRIRDRFLSAVICGSDQNRLDYVRRVGRDASLLKVVPLGVDVERFAPPDRARREEIRSAVRSELGLEPLQRLVGVVSALSEERKGVDVVLHVARLIDERGQDVNFVVVGDGPLRPSLERLAGELAVGDRVHFAGHRDDVTPLLAAMDVFMQPSHWEAGPYSVFEAMAMGTPAVTTGVGLVATHVVDGVHALVVPAGDSQALASRVTRLLGDHELASRLSDAGRHLVVSSLSTDVMIERNLAVYENARLRARHRP